MDNHVVCFMEAPLPVIPSPAAATHDLGGTRFTSLATPSRGTADTAVWQVEIDPDVAPTVHSLTREEVFVVLSGAAAVELGGARSTAKAGDAIVVPADTPFSVGSATDEPLRMLCCLPVGGQARLADGSTFTPPWAE
jgi:mannose-6-phosphate isomerase-like protein (cupin superfamily)